jgi:hypothetical protein
MLKLRAFNNITKRWRWVEASPIKITDPVVIPFDHPDIATGVDFGFVGGLDIYPITALFDVTETFDGSSVFRVKNQDGIDSGVGSDISGSQGFGYAGPCVEPLYANSGGADRRAITSLNIILAQGTPTQGSVTVRVLYCDLS